MFGTRITTGLSVVKNLWTQQLAPHILISGGINEVTGINEAHHLSGMLVQDGLPDEVILREDQSTNTKENNIFSIRLLENFGLMSSIKKVLLVVKNYHARRSVMCCRRWFPKDVKFYPIPYAPREFDRHNWHQYEIGRQYVEQEYDKISRYLAWGDLRELDPVVDAHLLYQKQ